MKLRDLAEQDLELVELARDLVKKRKSQISSVAAVLRTKNGRIFRGVNIEIEASAPCSICAEYAAIGTMVTEGEKAIDTIVAVSTSSVLPPCGQCRQFIREFGNPFVIVEVGGALKKAELSDLYPLPVVSDPHADQGHNVNREP